MRERKFKVWDKQEKRMLIALVDDLISLDMNGWIYCNGEFRPEYQERFIVLFWTGLKDKNGKEIFEEDIVKVFGYDEIFEVIFNQTLSAFQFGSFQIRSISKLNNLGKDDLVLNDCEVIGNIYENPELLEETKN